MFDVITIGAATADLFISSFDFSLQDNPSSPTGQYLVIPSSFKAEINNYLFTSGGGATNTAVSFARFGHKTACIALLGQDHYGSQILEDLSQNQVSTEFIIKDNFDATDFSIILRDPKGGRTILANRGSTSLQEKDIPWSSLQSKWLYITSLEGNLSLLEKLIGHATEHNISVALNPGSRELHKLDLLRPLLKYVDFLQVNTLESELLTQSSFNSQNFWTIIQSFKSKIIAITNGRQGAHIISQDENYFSPIINFSPIDETGAGDAFGSAFVSSLILNQDLKTSLSWAMQQSGSVVGFLGAKTGLLTKAQMLTKIV